MMRIETVAVIGAGTMRERRVCSSCWKQLYTMHLKKDERGMERINTFWDKGIARGK